MIANINQNIWFFLHHINYGKNSPCTTQIPVVGESE